MGVKEGKMVVVKACFTDQVGPLLPPPKKKKKKPNARKRKRPIKENRMGQWSERIVQGGTGSL